MSELASRLPVESWMASSETAEIVRNLLMYFILPVWLAAGFAD
jgi:hypothetical protein